MAKPTEDHLAPYAIRSGEGGRREHTEPADALRGPFELDRHRIIESTAFRRLEHKTQVFAPGHHDHFRTRLTHTLEVAQIARCLAVALRASEALTEAIALAHDLGHPPFGHAGEAALTDAMSGDSGFNHNTHSLRIVEYLEHPFPAFRGLNLTVATRAGLATHATRYDVPQSEAEDPTRAAGFSPRGRTEGGHAAGTSEPATEVLRRPSVEAQIASVADRIAYNCHDLEDAIGAGFVDLADLTEVHLWQSALAKASAAHTARNIHAIRRAVLDAMVDTVLADVIKTATTRLAATDSAESIAEQVVAPSAGLDAQLAELEGFLAERVYRHPAVAETDARGRRMVLALFDAYRRRPDALPDRFSSRIEHQGLDRVICDYIAGMTDRFATNEHDRLLGE